MGTLAAVVALVLDRLLGEPRRFHPLVGFGTLAAKVEEFTRACLPAGIAGACGWLLLIAPPVALLWWWQSAVPASVALITSVLVFYLCVGGRSLAEHARAIAEPLARGDLPAARKQLAMIVSRDTENLDSSAVAAASVESVLENGSDAVLAPLFWFVLLGAPGALLYRLVNTLDAMWGYRNAMYAEFGRTAAVLDDCLNRPPAVFCATAYALCGQTQSALTCWRDQAPSCASPNGGAVMSAGAGALHIAVGGSATYHGERHERPVLGLERRATAEDILRALGLLRHALLLWLLTIAVLEWLL